MRSRLKYTTFAEIVNRYQEQGDTARSLRARDLAKLLDCSEAELVGAALLNSQVSALDSAQLPALMKSLVAEGSWMTLLRSEGAVMERDAQGWEIQTSGEALCLRATDVELTLQLNEVAFAFWVVGESGPVRSLQLFDRQGTAIAKLYLRSEAFAEQADAAAKPFVCAMPEGLETEIAEVAVAQDLDAGRAAAALARVRGLLEWARAEHQGVRLQVSNRGGCMQVTHQPDRLVAARGWYNILDQGFNLHLREADIADLHMEKREHRLGVGCLDVYGAEMLRLELSEAASPVASLTGGAS